MTEERKTILVDYIQTIAKGSYEVSVMKKIQGALLFLENAETLNRRGYNKFKKEHASELATDERLHEGVLFFLNFLGVGYQKTVKNRPEKLEKLSKLSDKNRQLVNDFVAYLSENNDYSSSAMYLYCKTMEQYYSYASVFSQENCRRFIVTLEDRGLSPQTIRLRITALEKFGEFVKKSIALKRPKMTRVLHTDNIPTEAEYNRLLEYLRNNNPRYYIYVRLLATTGARVSELLQFRWSDILNGEVTLKGKGNKYRHFFFSKSIKKEVADYLKEHPADGVVCVNRFDEPMSDRGLNQMLKSIGARCNIDKSKMHPHAFRHFFAKMYLKKTKDVVQLAELLGHHSVDTTRIYLQKSYEEQKREFNRDITW